MLDKLKDKMKRHKERISPLGFQSLLSDSIDFVQPAHWDPIAGEASIFLRRAYLQAIEACSPPNTYQRYAVAFVNGKPAVILACQVAQINGGQLVPAQGKEKSKVKGKKDILAESYQERILVCGNLVSSGLHGIAFASGLDKEQGWRMAAELLYKIRRSEKLAGMVDFVMIKDIKGAALKDSEITERYSYRRIKTDPDMVLELDKKLAGFEDYLGALNTKYRSRVKKVAKTIEESGYTCVTLKVDAAMDRVLHGLYLEVESRSATRPARLPEGYFKALSDRLGDDFVCRALRKGKDIAGFISIVRDGDEAIAYYVGFRYDLNGTLPIYFRLLQLVIETAIGWKCTKVSFGRTALGPKADLGAKPVECHVWVRHRVPVVNWVLRKLFHTVPFEDAPQRSVFKEAKETNEAKSPKASITG